MNKNFNITEILESVDSIILDTRHRPHIKKKNIDDIEVNPETEKIINDAEKFLKGKSHSRKNKNINVENIKSKIEDDIDILILDNEFIEENNLKDLKNTTVPLNKKLKNENIKLEEKIKDQTVLIDKFLSQKRYSELDKIIKLYQEDNAALRKKIFELSNKEANLRLELSDLTLSKNIIKKNKIED